VSLNFNLASPDRTSLAVAWSAVLGLLIAVLGQGAWGALVVSNLRTSPAVPWAVPVMAILLWLLWRYLGGKWWPRSTAEARRRYLRANPVSGRAFTWALLAGTLSIVAFAGYWIVMVQLVKLRGNALPDLSQYPLPTVVLMLMMGSLAAPLTEEPAFRGYCQVILEREFRGPAAVLISSVLFALAHGPTQGFLWPKLLFYFLVGWCGHMVLDPRSAGGHLHRPGDPSLAPVGGVPWAAGSCSS
jgi:membrane protease YdiL (CAAX protease family)